MLPQIKRWIVLPVNTHDDEKSFRTGLLNVSIIVVIILLILVIIGNLLGGEIPKETLVIDGIMLVIALLLRILMFHGKIILASIGLVVFAFIIITAAIISLGTIRTPTTAAYILIIILAGLLLDYRGLILTTVLSSLAVLGLVLAENNGLLPLPNINVNITQWVTYTALFGMAGGLSTYAHLTIRSTLHSKIEEIIERKKVEKDNEKLIGELRDALAEVKKLSGLLPICANCKKRFAGFVQLIF